MSGKTFHFSVFLPSFSSSVYTRGYIAGETIESTENKSVRRRRENEGTKKIKERERCDEAIEWKTERCWCDGRRAEPESKSDLLLRERKGREGKKREKRGGEFNAASRARLRKAEKTREISQKCREYRWTGRYQLPRLLQTPWTLGCLLRVVTTTRHRLLRFCLSTLCLRYTFGECRNDDNGLWSASR